MPRSTSSSTCTSSRSSPDLTINYRTLIDGQITAFKMWRVDNQADMEQRFPGQINRPNGMYNKVKGFWRYRVSQEEKDYYYEMEAVARAGGEVAHKPYVRMEPVEEVYEEVPVLEHVEPMEPIQDFKPQDHIKRPMNAYILWGQAERKRIHERAPRMTATEISRKLGENWKRMSDREKKPFFEQAQKLKKQHQMMYPDYKFQPKKLMSHLETMNRRLGRSFNPIQRPTSSRSSESPKTSESRSTTPYLDAMLAQPLVMAQNLNYPMVQNFGLIQNPLMVQNPSPIPNVQPEYVYEYQNENQDPSTIEYDPNGLATMKQRCDLHLLPSKYLCPESEENFSTYANIPMALGYADLPVFY